MKAISGFVVQYVPHLFFAVGLVLTVFLYTPGLDGGFYFDDSHVIEDNRFIEITDLSAYHLIRAANSFGAGGREISMLSFALNHYFFGDSAWWYKAVNLAIHLINGLGLFLLCDRILNILAKDGRAHRSRIIALAAAVLWLVHPINLTSVLYISQRMALLSTFFIVYGLLFYLWARQGITDTIRKRVYLPLGIAGFVILGYRCKENAALLPLYIVLMEIIVLKFRDFQSWRQTDREVVRIMLAGLLLAVAGLAWIWLQTPDFFTRGYANRYYSMDERVLTQFRALAFYLGQIVVPSNGSLSLWHDDFGLSVGLFSPPTTFFSLLLLLALILGAVGCIKKQPLLSFGLLWFFVSHCLESTLLPLELVHEHRNYLAGYGIILALLILVNGILKERTTVRTVFVIGVLVAWSTVLYQRAYIWSDVLTHAEHTVSARPHSAKAHYELAKQYYHLALDGRDDFAHKSFAAASRAASLDPYTIIPEIALVLLSDEFETIDYRSHWLKSATKKLRKHPYMAPSNSALSSFSRCMKTKSCTAPEEDVAPLFRAAFDSDNYVLLSAAAEYYADVADDPQRARQAFKRALNNKNAVTWVNYLNFLLHKKDTTEGCLVYGKFQQKIANDELKRIALYIPDYQRFKVQFKDCGA